MFVENIPSHLNWVSSGSKPASQETHMFLVSQIWFLLQSVPAVHVLPRPFKDNKVIYDVCLKENNFQLLFRLNLS